LEALRLLVGMHVDPLRVLDQLPFEGLGVVDLDDAGRNGEEFCKLSCTVAPRSCDQLEAIRVGAHGDGLDEAVVPDAFGKLLQLALLEGAAGVGGGLVDGVDSEVLECAAVLHLAALLGRV